MRYRHRDIRDIRDKRRARLETWEVVIDCLFPLTCAVLTAFACLVLPNI